MRNLKKKYYDIKKIFFCSIHFLISIKLYNINIFPQRIYI